MKICKACSKEFNSTIVVNNKRRNLANRLYCFECSPWLAHNTRPILSTEEKEKLKEKGLKKEEFICSNCSRLTIKDRDKGNRGNICNSCVTNKRRYEIKNKAIKYLGSICIDCKNTFEDCVYDFHHLDPKEKDFQISSAHCRSWEKIKKELDKCALLCSNCHRTRHSQGKSRAKHNLEDQLL